MTSLDDVVRLRDKARKADDEYRRAIMRAREDGYSLRVIAKAIGVTHQTVANLIADRPHS